MSKTVSNWIYFFCTYKFEILVGIALLFFIVLIVFSKPIGNWLKDKKDWKLPSSTFPNLYDRKIPRKVRQPIQKKHEKKCREIFQSIFNKPFPTVRPSFLKRAESSCPLELDGYNSDLKLAFEYNGIQHYKYSPYFHKSMQDFVAQKKRDKDKEVLCRANGITLITIPANVPYNDLEKFIKKSLKTYGY